MCRSIEQTSMNIQISRICCLISWLLTISLSSITPDTNIFLHADFFTAITWSKSKMMQIPCRYSKETFDTKNSFKTKFKEIRTDMNILWALQKTNAKVNSFKSFQCYMSIKKSNQMKGATKSYMIKGLSTCISS